MENHRYTGAKTNFKGWQVKDFSFKSFTHECLDCANSCEVISIVQGEPECIDPRTPKEVKGDIIARWGGTCGKWDLAESAQQNEMAHK